MKKVLLTCLVLASVVLSTLLLPGSAQAIEWCCPSGYTNCKDGGAGNDRYACAVRGFHNDATKCVQSSYNGINPIPKVSVTSAYNCEIKSGEAKLACEWTLLNDPSSEYHNKPAFCLGGFVSVEQGNASTTRFECTENCGDLFGQLGGLFSGNSVQTVSGGSIWGQSEEGYYYTCYTGNFDSTVESTVKDCLIDNDVIRVGTTGGGALIGAAIPAANVVTIPLGAAGGALLSRELVSKCETTITTTTVFDDLSCSDELKVQIDINGDLVSDEERQYSQLNLQEFSLCEQATPGEDRNKCLDCFSGSGEFDSVDKGVWTALGCIDRSAENIVGAVVKIGIGIAGGAALLQIIAAGFMLTASQGDPKKTSDAREQIQAAVIGILFIIFSVTILQFIGVQIFRLPGF